MSHPVHNQDTKLLAGSPRIRYLGLSDYESTLQDMQAFTQQRQTNTRDEIWVLQHPAVYTLGLNAKSEHIHSSGDIPVVHVDRGGQVTYHGPGQLVVYLLLDLRRRGLGVRQLVEHMEQALIDLLARYDIDAHGRREAPGVYVGDAKIAALGLRIKHGCCYHGLAFNVDMDLAPFKRVNPCGYTDLPVTQLSELGVYTSPTEIAKQLLPILLERLGYPSELNANG
jgi:lipoyl(octanoyl) transferase